MEEGRRNNFLNLLTLLQILSIVNGSGDAFQRIDKNDEGNTVVGLTRFFHQCSIDSGCNFVVKKNEDSELEKLQNVDDVTKYYNVWKRLKKQAFNVALNKPVSMSSQYTSKTVASNAVDGNLDSYWENCALTQKEPTSPWLFVDLLSEYHILYVRIKNRDNEDYARSQPFDVRVGNNNQNGGIYNAFCVQQGSIPTQNTMKRFDCPQGTRGRYISFHTPPNQSYLEICELEVYSGPA